MMLLHVHIDLAGQPVLGIAFCCISLIGSTQCTCMVSAMPEAISAQLAWAMAGSHSQVLRGR